MRYCGGCLRNRYAQSLSAEKDRGIPDNVQERFGHNLARGYIWRSVFSVFTGHRDAQRNVRTTAVALNVASVATAHYVENHKDWSHWGMFFYSSTQDECINA